MESSSNFFGPQTLNFVISEKNQVCWIGTVCMIRFNLSYRYLEPEHRTLAKPKKISEFQATKYLHNKIFSFTHLFSLPKYQDGRSAKFWPNSNQIYWRSWKISNHQHIVCFHVIFWCNACIFLCFHCICTSTSMPCTLMWSTKSKQGRMIKIKHRCGRGVLKVKYPLTLSPKIWAYLPPPLLGIFLKVQKDL